MHAVVRHGTPSLTSLPKDGEVSCEVQALAVTHPEFDLTRANLTSQGLQQRGAGGRAWPQTFLKNIQFKAYLKIVLILFKILCSLHLSKFRCIHSTQTLFYS